jgi:hypothetical protein
VPTRRKQQETERIMDQHGDIKISDRQRTILAIIV